MFAARRNQTSLWLGALCPSTSGVVPSSFLYMVGDGASNAMALLAQLRFPHAGLTASLKLVLKHSPRRADKGWGLRLQQS